MDHALPLPAPSLAPSVAPNMAALDDIKRLSQAHAAPVDPVLACIELLCSHQGSPLPAAVLGAGLSLRKDGRVDPTQLLQAAQAHGLLAQFSPVALDKISAFALPVVLLLQDGSACVLLRAPTSPGSATNVETTNLATVLLPESGPTEHEVPWNDLKAKYSGHALYVKPHRAVDERGDHVPEVKATSWFWDILGRYKRYYLHVGLATVVVNVLSLVASMFSMTVYDRVVPNQAFSTLWVLAVGVGCATAFEFMARMLRAWLTDIAGKKADVVMSSVLFRRVLNLRLDQRPQSAGSFANTLRDYESVRDFVTSATLLALADLPFVFLFLGVMVVVAGPLAWVPAVAMAIILVVTLVAQWPIAKLMAQYMRGMSRKQSIAVETVEGLEALRANRAESVMQTRWDDCNAAIAAFSAKSRMINAWVMNLVSSVQQASSVALIIWGVYAIADNALTMGGLIAASILAGRAIAPISQVAGLGLRWQQARTSLKGLNELMQRAQDRDATRTYVHAPSLSGAFALQNITHRFGGPDATASLDRATLNIKAGERVAVLGRVGSGKSTLLRVAAGLLPPSEGSVTLDGLDLRQIEPSDVRRHVAYVGQDATLFHGTLKENILLGAQGVDAERLAKALAMTGLDRVVAAHPRGLDLPIGEGGAGLSGGQRQLVALARLFVRDPQLVLLDEPTSAMDNATEAQMMQALSQWLKGRTLVLVTHRMPWVALAERVVVVDQGRVVLDGPKEQALQQLAKGLNSGPQGPAAPPARAVVPVPLGGAVSSVLEKAAAAAASAASAASSAKTAPSATTAKTALAASAGTTVTVANTPNTTQPGHAHV